MFDVDPIFVRRTALAGLSKRSRKSLVIETYFENNVEDDNRKFVQILPRWVEINVKVLEGSGFF